MLFRVFDTQLGVKGVKDIGKLWHCLVPFLSQCGPSRVLIIIASDRVILLLKSILKICLGGYVGKHASFLCGCFLTVGFSPIFDMGNSFKEGKSYLLPIGKIIDQKITFYQIYPFLCFFHIFVCIISSSHKSRSVVLERSALYLSLHACPQ